MIARLRGRLAESGGYTLTEMLVVLAILGIVLAALVQLFVSASNAQVDMNNRFQAQQNARLALDGLRREIHCASAVPPDTAGDVASRATSITITLRLATYCPTNTTACTGDVTWCTKDDGRGDSHYRAREPPTRFGATTGRRAPEPVGSAGREPDHRRGLHDLRRRPACARLAGTASDRLSDSTCPST